MIKVKIFTCKHCGTKKEYPRCKSDKARCQTCNKWVTSTKEKLVLTLDEAKKAKKLNLLKHHE